MTLDKLVSNHSASVLREDRLLCVILALKHPQEVWEIGKSHTEVN